MVTAPNKGGDKANPEERDNGVMEGQMIMESHSMHPHSCRHQCVHYPNKYLPACMPTREAKAIHRRNYVHVWSIVRWPGPTKQGLGGANECQINPKPSKQVGGDGAFIGWQARIEAEHNGGHEPKDAIPTLFQ